MLIGTLAVKWEVVGVTAMCLTGRPGHGRPPTDDPILIVIYCIGGAHSWSLPTHFLCSLSLSLSLSLVSHARSRTAHRSYKWYQSRLRACGERRVATVRFELRARPWKLEASRREIKSSWRACGLGSRRSGSLDARDEAWSKVGALPGSLELGGSKSFRTGLQDHLSLFCSYLELRNSVFKTFLCKTKLTLSSTTL